MRNFPISTGWYLVLLSLKLYPCHFGAFNQNNDERFVLTLDLKDLIEDFVMTL